MDIIFHGKHDSEEAAESLLSVLRLFKEKYHITTFKEMHLHLTLLNPQGEEVELVNTDTKEVYRNFEVYRKMKEEKAPGLQLVVDNTH